MGNIDKDLISNKTSCYIFDVDGCLADVDHILLTYGEVYDKAIENYNIALKRYEHDKIDYEFDLKRYNKGEIEQKPIEPVEPIRPNKYEEGKKNRWDSEYFYRHLNEAIPIGGIIDLFIALSLTKKVIILTGREEHSKPATLEWLNKAITDRSSKDMYRRINFSTIFKPDRNMDPTEKFKKEKVLELAKQYNVQLIIDDCPKNIETFTQLGFLALTPNRIYKDLK